MISILCLCVLIMLIWLTGSHDTSSFHKGKTLILKAMLPLMIICHHVAVFSALDVKPIGVFREWGFLVVGIFFFISGFGLMKSYEIKQKEYLKGFLYKKLCRSLLVPYIYACIFFYCILQIFDNPISIKSIISNFYNHGDTFLPYSWFVIVIMICYVNFYLSVRWFPKHPLTGVIILSFVLMIALHLYGMPDYWIVSIPSFPLGAVFCKYESQTLNLFRTKRSLLIPLLLLIGIILAIKFFVSDGYYYILKNCIISLLITVAFICSTFVLKSDKAVALSIIIFLSSISYEIYLTHGIVMVLLKNQLYRIDNPLLYIPLLFCGTIALSWLLHSTRQIISNKFSKKR